MSNEREDIHMLKRRICDLEESVKHLQLVIESAVNGILMGINSPPNVFTCRQCNMTMYTGQTCSDSNCCHGLNELEKDDD